MQANDITAEIESLLPRGHAIEALAPRRDPLFGFAALWERDTCSLITTEPNDVMRDIHDRMPVIVAKDDYDEWLAGEKELPELRGVLMAMHAVGMAVNQAANDGPQLIAPVELDRGLFD